MVRRSVAPLILISLMLLMSWGALIDAVEETENIDNPQEIETVDIVLNAPSPGHVVFAEYVGGQNCPPCYGSASPSLKQLKNANTDEFVYISYIAASYGTIRTAQAGEVSPINRISHLDSSGSNSAPRAYFGDCAHGSSSCYMAGSGGNNNYDDFFSGASGKSNNMHSTVNDYSLAVTQSPNGNNVDITVSASYSGSGTKTVSVFAAVTENVCHSYAYNDGSKPGHCWKKWLTNSNNDAFVQLTLSSTPATYSWSVPKSTVYNSDHTNMMTVAALMSDWSSGATRYDILSAADSDMNPLDLSVTDFTYTNMDAQTTGFLSGDTLKFDATVGNTGTEDYSDGGQIQFYQVSSTGSESPIGSAFQLNSLNVGQTQSVSEQFDTSSIQMDQSDPQTVFRVKLTGTQGEADPVGNNVRVVYAAHDMAPSTSKPIANGNTAIDRGETLDFEVTGQPNDNVDTLSTMSAEIQSSPTGMNQWIDTWFDSGTFMQTGVERFIFTVTPPNSASSGSYDVRARMIDARGQVGDWSPINTDAFTLMNGLPMVVTSDNIGEVPDNCPAYPGQPTVKVETIERIDVSGIICDAETPLDQLVISSTNPAFRVWDASAGEIEVRFDSVQSDPNTQDPITQPIQLTINDGEDSNTGTLHIMVIENGAPRWSPLPTQSFNEGDGTSILLTSYLTDTDSDGDLASSTDLTLSIQYISNNSLITADFTGPNGHRLNIDGVDDNAFGTGMVIVRATDVDGQYADTELPVIVANVNDAPTLDTTSFDNLRIKVSEEFTFDVVSNMNDVDDNVEPLYVTVSCDTWKAGSRYNPLDGVIKAWFEEEGIHTITIIVADVHDDVNAYYVTVEVIDSLPLAWSENTESGDLMAHVDGLYINENPTFNITDHSGLDLTNVEIEWNVCNSDTGICTDLGTESVANLDDVFSFTITKSSGSMLFHDQIKISLSAIDSDGFERKTSSDAVFDVTEERPEDVVDDTPEDSTSNEDSTTASSATPSIAVLAIAGAFVVAVLIALILGVMLLRGGKEQENLGMGYGTAPPPLPGMPPTPPMPLGVVPDYSQLPAGGNYSTNPAGQTVYHSPDNTDWTMQPDNSFIRTR